MEKKIQNIIEELKSESTLFHSFDEGELEKIAHFFRSEIYPAGEVIFKEGDPGDFVGLITSGSVEVKKVSDFPGKYIVLAQLKSGSIIGEFAMLDEHPRSATVVAIEDTEIITLSRDSLEAFFAQYPAIGIKLLKGISRILTIRLRQSAKRLTLIF